MILKAIIMVAAVGMLSPIVAQDAQKVGPSGSMLPRFVSLSADEANMRTGPGRQYPIEWVYRRRNLPLEVIDEFGPWRQVRDHEGTVGWMHVLLLSNKRTALITHEKLRLFADPSSASDVTMIVDRGIVAVVDTCEQIWCKLEIDGSDGWTERRHLWGLYPNEIIK
jgi:SH3-like domain-containing protein